MEALVLKPVSTRFPLKLRVYLGVTRGVKRRLWELSGWTKSPTVGSPWNQVSRVCSTYTHMLLSLHSG